MLHAVVFDQLHDHPLTTLELDMFLGWNYLVTYRTKPLAAIDSVWTACQRDERCMQNGAGYLLYKVADELVADYLPAVERIDEAIDPFEDQVFDNPTPSMLESIFALKRALLHLRRVIAPQREALNKLARGDYAVIDVEQRIFFRDVYDHLVRLYDIAESLRDLVGSALDTYLSVVNNRMNEVMKTPTVITTLFLPITFLVGFFGTNFLQPVAPPNAFTDHPTSALFTVSMLVLPVGMYVWMRKRAWM